MADVIQFPYRVGRTSYEPISGAWIDSENPATGEVWAQVPDCGKEDIDRAVAAAVAASRNGEWQRLSAAERGRALTQVAAVIRANADKLAEVETRDNGKLPGQIRPGLEGGLAGFFDYYAGMADKFEGSVIPVNTPGIFNYQTWEPFGVVGLITAWNSPLGVLLIKLAPALAAGNAVVIKPSEHASVSTLVLAEVLAEADVLPEGLINVVTGYGPTAGTALVEHPDVGMISFTGGLAGGQAVARAAAQRVKPCVMELGGKSPQIVLTDADIEQAARGIAAGIFPPAGQSCVAGSRILVQSGVYDAFVERLTEIAGRARVGAPTDADTQIGPIANKPHYERVVAQIAAGDAAGHRLLLDGRTACRDQGYYIGPTLFADVPGDAALAQEEIFGPVASVTRFETLDEARQLANGTDYGLAAGIWTRDTAQAMRLTQQIEAGTVYINNYFDASPQSPVGGFKQSGHGRESGWEGMRAYMQSRSVWLDLDPDHPDPFAAPE